MGFANFLEVTGIAMRASVIAYTTPVAIVFAAIIALINVPKRKGG